MTETPTDSARAEAQDAPAPQESSTPTQAAAPDAPAAERTTEQPSETSTETATETATESSTETSTEQGSADRTRRSAPSPERLEEEGDVAADYLEELLDIVDLDGDIDIDVENGRASVSVVADAGSERSLRRLVGDEGVVLEALQELTRLAVQARTGERTRLMLDVAGFRAARRVELEKLAGEAVERVRADGGSVSLDPMSPFERKVVHDAVAAAGLRSESEGEDTRRHVVVLPADA